jgi:metal-sulfur cluster biosynthetic enzyme
VVERFSLAQISASERGFATQVVEVLNQLRQVMDPDLGSDIVTLGFIKNLTLAGGDVAFVLELTTPACPVKVGFDTDPFGRDG